MIHVPTRTIELTSVSDVPERTAEEDLLREVGLSDPS